MPSAYYITIVGQTMWTQIKLIRQDQFDLRPHCLSKKASKIFQQTARADDCGNLLFRANLPDK